MSTFTRMYINPQKRQARKLLTNPQVMHAAVRAAFPPDISEDESRVLWRVDHRGDAYTLYVVGPEKPDAMHLVEQAGWESRPADTADYSRFLNSLTRGQHWRFQLVANPVVSRSTGNPKQRGKRVPLVNPTAQVEWLQQKAQAAGFSLIHSGAEDADVRVIGSTDERFFRRRSDEPRKDRPVQIRRVRFEGHLEVLDAQAMRATLCNGFGRGKAYGCGLITLAPPVAFDG